MQIRTKIWQNNVKSPTAPRFSTIARPPNGPKSIHNASIASNMVLNTSQGTQEVNKLISEGFRYKLGPKSPIFAFSQIASGANLVFAKLRENGRV